MGPMKTKAVVKKKKKSVSKKPVVKPRRSSRAKHLSSSSAAKNLSLSSSVKHLRRVSGPSDSVIKIIARTKTESVQKHTGKNWDQWISILKKAGGDFWEYKEIVSFLQTKHKLSMWWQQIVANGFQVHTGVRQVGENSKGMYSVTMARNLKHPLIHVWKKFASTEGIQIWLNPMGEFSLNIGAQFEIADGIYGELRTMMSQRRVRMKWINEDWPKTTYIQFNLHEFKPGKCMIVVSHGDLANAKIKEEMRLFWLERINNFINFL